MLVYVLKLYSRNSMKEEPMNKHSFKAGDKVYYTTTGSQWETYNGIIKSISARRNLAYVVYKCNNDWDNYQNYTAEATNMDKLKRGWLTT
jgi:hypothetical protein